MLFNVCLGVIVADHQIENSFSFNGIMYLFFVLVLSGENRFKRKSTKEITSMNNVNKQPEYCVSVWDNVLAEAGVCENENLHNFYYKL